MKSKTKFPIDNSTIKKLFDKAGISGITDCVPLGAGEYNAVFEVRADKNYVLKVAPHDSAPILTYEKDMIKSEVYWYSQIREFTDITVPEVYYCDFSRSIIPAGWFIMEKIEGRPRNKFDFSEAEKEQSLREEVKMLAEIHRIHNDSYGYIQNGLHDNWYSALRSMVANLLADCGKKGKRSVRGERLLSYIDKYKDIFEKVGSSLVNYDLWDPNIICRRENGEVKFTWIDSERCFWGDRIFDFICIDFMSSLGGKQKALNLYNLVAESPITVGREENIRFAAAEALMALIQESEKYYRYTPCNFGWWRNVVSSGILYKKAFAVFGSDGKE